MLERLVLWSMKELILFVLGTGLLAGALVWIFLNKKSNEAPWGAIKEDMEPELEDDMAAAADAEDYPAEPESIDSTEESTDSSEEKAAPAEAEEALRDEEDFPETEGSADATVPQEAHRVSWRERINEKLRKRHPETPGEAEDTPDTREQLRRMEQLVQFQQQAISTLEKQVEDAARMRHDFRRELLALKEFARSGEREAIERYLPEIRLEKQTLRASLCANPLVDVLLQYYIEQGQSNNVEMDISVEASEHLWLDAADLSVLLSNLLENGVVASAEAPEGQRRLRLRTLETEDLFAIVMGNTFGSPRSPEGATFASTKADHKGIGLDSISRIAERFGGEASFHVEDELFMSCVLLLRPMDSSCEQTEKLPGSAVDDPE